MDMDGVTHIDFIGIGGIGMSSLARWAMTEGIVVSGYDKTPSSLTADLEREGATVRYSAELIDWDIPDTAWVVYTPAIPADHPQLMAAKASGRTVIKRAVMLGKIANAGRCFAIAGTHGKTTTSALLAWLLHQGGIPVQAFLGGISTNFKSNFLAGPASITVVEADEFDRSFLQLNPEIAAITSTDADHLDIYGQIEEVQTAFEAFAQRCKTVYRSVHANLKEGTVYGIDQGSYCAEDVRISQGQQYFTLNINGNRIRNVVAGLPGLHNVENAVAAACLAYHAGLDLRQIAAGIESFKGVRRRFERVFESEQMVLIDDYAHHPTEIKNLLESLRKLYPNRRIAVLFQPHLYSRTKDFCAQFQLELQKADSVGILPIYPAREEPLPGVTSAWLSQGIPQATVLNYGSGAAWLANRPETVKVTMGAGDIDRLIPDVLENVKQAIQ